MASQPEQLLGKGARRDLGQAAVAMEPQQGAAGMELFPMMEELMGQEDRPRPLRKRFRIVRETPVQRRDRRPEEPDARWPGHIVGEDHDGAETAVALDLLDRDTELSRDLRWIARAALGPQLARGRATRRQRRVSGGRRQRR
jgi:hypothetical protein